MNRRKCLKFLADNVMCLNLNILASFSFNPEGSTPSTPVEGSSPASVVVPAADGPAATSKPEGCTLNNQTFEFGDEHFDGCNYKCRCENSGEFTCLVRI